MRNEAGVEEKSHKSEMRAALQGDFERLRSRRQSGLSGPAVERPTSEPATAQVPPTDATPAAEPGSWLDRLRGRR
jgi:hypothetical protein